MELDTEHVRMLNAGRQCAAYSSPISTSCFSSVNSTKTQLLQHGNTYGLTFVASKTGFVMTRSDELEASCTDYTKRRQEALDHRQNLTLKEIHELPVSKEIQLPSIAYWIALSVDELMLAVAYGDSVALFEVAHIIEAVTPKPYLTFSELQAQEIAWCSDPTCEQLTVLTLEKQVISCMLEGSRQAIHTEVDASSVSWSPSGQQIAIGLVDGTIAIYARASLKLLRSINQPSCCANLKVEVHHINWVEEEVFLAGYHQYDDENDRTIALACIFDRGECIELDEIAGFVDVEGRRHQFFSVYLSEWRMFFVGCSLSADIELLVSDPESGEWQLWKPLERYQARLPDNSEDEESFLMGLSLNLNSTVPVSVDGDPYPPVPIISCTNTEGLLLHFAFVDTTVHEVEFVKSPLPFAKKSTRTLAATTSVILEAKTKESVSPKKLISNEYGQNDENEFADSDGDSIDGEEERKEEEDNARTTFRSIAIDGAGFIASEQFPKLFKAMGSTYDEEEHASTVERLSKGGKIYEDDFVSWYVNWIFDDEELELEKEEGAFTSPKAEPTKMKSKEEIAAAFLKFTAAEGSWKCAVCIVSNGPDAIKCSACETPNPAAPKEVALATSASAAFAGSIGSSGFSFPVSAGKDLKVSSPSFGVTSVANSSALPEVKFAGFSFNGTSTTTASSVQDNTMTFGTGFSFGTTTSSAAPATPSAFNFGVQAKVFSDAANASKSINSFVKDTKSLSLRNTTSHEYGQNDENEFADSDGESSDEEEQRKEEEATARVTFRTLASDGANYIASKLFPKLFKAMGSTYDEEEHASTVESLSIDGKIYEDDFVSWYVNWIFGDEDNESEEEAKSSALSTIESAEMKSKEEIAAVFSRYAAKEGSWKCTVCMVSNDSNAMKCSACESPNPAAPKVVAPVTTAGTLTGSIGSSGFSFPGSTNSKTSSFSFGVTPVAGFHADNEAKTNSLSFSGASSSTPISFSSGTIPSSSGLSLPNTTKLALDSDCKNETALEGSKGFTNGSADTPSKSKASAKSAASGSDYPPDTTLKPKPPAFQASGGNGYPPDTTSKPKPPAFGAASGYPPDTTSKPKPPAFGAASSSGYPPDTMSRPKPPVFGAATTGDYPPNITAKAKSQAFDTANSGSYPPDTSTKPKLPAFGQSTTSVSTASTSSFTNNASGKSIFAPKPELSKPFDVAQKSPFGLAPNANSAFSLGSTRSSDSFSLKPSSTRPSFSFDSFSSTLDTTERRDSPKEQPPTKRTLKFGNSNAFEATASTNPFATTKAKLLTNATKTSKHLPSSRMEGQLWKLIVDFDKSLQRVNQSATTIASKDVGVSKNLVTQLDKFRGQISSLCDKLNDLNEARDRIEKDVLFVIGSDGDVHEQLEYGREILDSFNDQSLKRTLDEQPLDARSKEAFESLTKKLSEVNKCCEELESHLLSFKSGADRSGAVSSAHLFRVLKQTYDNSKAQYNKACKLAEQLEMLSLRDDRMRQTIGFRGIHQGQAEAQALVTKTDMTKIIVESEERSQEVRRHFLTLCNKVITPRDVFSTPRRKLATLTPSTSNSPLQSKVCSKLMPKTQLSVASPISTAKPSARSVSFKDAFSKSESKLVALAEAMTPRDEPIKLVQTPQTSVGVGKAPQRPSLDASTTASKPTTLAPSKPNASSFTKDSNTNTFGASQVKEEKKNTSTTSPFNGKSPAIKLKRSADESSSAAFSLGGKDTQASSSVFSFGSSSTGSPSPAINYKTRLENFYKVHNPSKLGNALEKTLATYKGREEELFTRLFTMYLPTLTPEDVKTYLKGGPVPPKSVSEPRASQSPAPATAVVKSPFSGFGASASASTPITISPFGTSPSTFSLGPAASNSFASSTFGSAATGSSVSPFTTSTSSPFGKPAVNYRQKLVEFYQKHNPDKLSSVDATLQKYKGNEDKLFQNLALKYKVNDMSGGTAVPPASPAVQPVTSAVASPFGNSSVFSTPSTSVGMSFGSGSSPFGVAKPAPNASPFGAIQTPAPSPFGGTSQSSTGFGSATGSGFSGFQSATTTTPAFGAPSPFGTASSSFGAASGVNYRDKLTAFYQQHNPAKLSSVDATLAKYKGREDQLFGMLEQKYIKKTPVGVTSGGFSFPSSTAFAGAGSFGAPSALGAANPTPAFGSASTLGGTAQSAFAGSGFGMAARMGGGFGSAAPVTSSGTVAGSGFGAFGSQPPSFGGAVQQSSGFGAASSGGFGFGNGAATGGFGQPAAFSSSSFTQMR